MIIHSDLNKDNSFDDSKLCLICYEKYNEDESIKDGNRCVELSCGHKFHYNCIFMTYKSLKGEKKCPYCRKNGGYLPLIPGQVPTKYIHKEYNDMKNGKEFKIDLIPGKCKYILKTGKNAGCQCKFNIKTEQGYCNMHIKKIIN